MCSCDENMGLRWWCRRRPSGQTSLAGVSRFEEQLGFLDERVSGLDRWARTGFVAPEQIHSEFSYRVLMEKEFGIKEA